MAQSNYGPGYVKSRIISTKLDRAPVISPVEINMRSANDNYKRTADYFLPGEISFKSNDPKRLKEIESNLLQYASKYPEIFLDETRFKTNFGYDKRTPEQQAVLDEFYKKYTTPTPTISEYNDYTTESPRRLKEIVNNLDKYRDTNPELFKDKETFQNAFNYTSRAPSQKVVLDKYWKGDYGKYADNSKDRLKEIESNLNTYKEKYPELFKDKDTFKDKFNYNARSKKQKKILDNFWDDMF